MFYPFPLRVRFYNQVQPSFEVKKSLIYDPLILFVGQWIKSNQTWHWINVSCNWKFIRTNDQLIKILNFCKIDQNLDFLPRFEPLIASWSNRTEQVRSFPDRYVQIPDWSLRRPYKSADWEVVRNGRQESGKPAKKRNALLKIPVSI